MEVEGEYHKRSPEKADTFRRSKRRNREPPDEFTYYQRGESSTVAFEKGGAKASYRDMVVGKKSQTMFDKMEELDDGMVSNYDLVEEGDGKTWFGMCMPREEKIKARRPWCNSVVIRMVGRSVGYHYIWRQIQSMWRTQVEPLLIDLGNNYFIVKLTSREECIRASCDGLWMVGGNYLHIQRWRPNFIAEAARINSLPVCVRFPMLSVEYYNETWLCKARNHIGKTIKVDSTTLAASQSKFARVCIQVDLNKLLFTTYGMRGKDYQLQYEGLQDICFKYGKYDHHDVHCTPKSVDDTGDLIVEI